ncbi:hypothetical protein [Salinicola peritrichatus]|uniref:hypothetical protein n=1 Tax=Salinicola peritrichatus TaxID=1267424 RepID=UPI0013A656CF|nr:hypothetical protein [Salinicola peritrichatus]
MVVEETPIIALHLGVHKTATTHIQSKLWNSRRTLTENKINYIKLSELRKNVTSRLHNEDFGKKDILDFLLPYMNCNRLIISDENIIGGTNAPRKQLLYPRAKYKIKKIVDALKGYEVEVYITLREFSEYLISRYSESLRHYKFCLFEEYLEDIEFQNISWLPLLEDVSSIGCKKIYINDFEFVLNEKKYFELLLGKGLDLAEANQGAKIRRSKLSQQAYQVAKLYSELYSKKTTKKLIHMMDENPQDTAVTPFMPFSSGEREFFSRKYKREIEYINSNKFACEVNWLE